MIELIDINNDVYHFRMHDYEHYELIHLLAIKWQPNVQFSSTSDNNPPASYYIKAIPLLLITQNNVEAAASIDNVECFAVKYTPNFITVFTDYSVRRAAKYKQDQSCFAKQKQKTS